MMKVLCEELGKEDKDFEKVVKGYKFYGELKGLEEIKFANQLWTEKDLEK